MVNRFQRYLWNSSYAIPKFKKQSRTHPITIMIITHSVFNSVRTNNGSPFSGGILPSSYSANAQNKGNTPLKQIV